VERAREAGLDGFLVTRLFREILGHSLRSQESALGTAQAAPGATIRVGYQGIEGAYSHSAARRHFGPRDGEASYRGYDSFETMLDAVESEELDFAVLLLENTTSGSVTASYDLLARMDLALVGEEIQEVDHCLLALEEVPLSRIRRVFSHPVALSQCGRFLASLADCHVEAFTDTAMAAKRVRDEQDLSQAAVASEEAGRLYGLVVLKRGIADQRENYTRMAIVARRSVSCDLRVPCKTSLLFTTRHEEGALLRCLAVLADHHLSLTKLESRPRPRNPWEYLFYVDFEGNLAHPDVAEALRELAGRTSYLKVLGSYPSRTSSEARPAEPRPRASLPASLPEAPQEAPAAALKLPYRLAARGQRPEDTVVVVAGVPIGGSRPVVIAGPCAVESREQVRACARIVKEMGGDLLRGGCFKPRTSPYSFQGLGYEGLDMLAEAGAEVGLPIVTEVMHPAHVGPVAEKAHVLQIGARNMQNFSLLKEVGKVDRPVLLKRGMSSSIEELLSAAEYVLSQGNHMVILCERGIRTFETSTRNTLDLSAVPVLRERTHLPVIVDPSHAVGVRRFIPPMARAALAAGAQGLMIEIHPEPERALSDGPQALTFEMFERLMEGLARR
jgi:chorismate mutase/prephenate dehydratase